MAWHEYILNKDDKSIRGGFINMTITLSILGVTVYGLLFSPAVVEGLVKLGTFIVSFFIASYGIYSAKGHMDNRLEKHNGNGDSK